MSGKSFIENINTLADATALATGDAVEDANTYKNEALAASAASKTAEINSEEASIEAAQWATNAYNQPVKGTVAEGTAEFSAYHWATVAMQAFSNPIIDDTSTASNKTLSAQKIYEISDTKSDITHNHAGVYEPIIATKESAFNRAFSLGGGDNGTSITVARADHVHDTLYEPIINKNTAFNKAFGTVAGTVLEGNTLFDDRYMPLVVAGTAYNKNFVVNPTSPLPDEIPRGNHGHSGIGISYDNLNAKLVTSSTMQGAVDQLDTQIAAIEVAEKAKMGARLTNPNYTVTIITASEPVVVNAGMTLTTTSKNTLYNNGIQINYPVAPTKVVEGEYSASVTLQAEANTTYKIYVTVNSVPVTGYESEIGSSNSPAGAVSTTISGFLSDLANGDIVGIAIANTTNTNDVSLLGLNVSFAGQPEGNLVISGTTLNHSDLLGRDSIQQHPVSSIYEDGNTAVSLATLLDRKSDKLITFTTDNILTLDSNGNLKDSGNSISVLSTYLTKVSTPTANNFVIVNNDGTVSDSGVSAATFASSGGSSTTQFSVAAGTAATDAVNKSQLDALEGVTATQVALTAHTSNTSNPHSVTLAQVGAAAASHTHTLGDITSLTQELADKYPINTSAVQGNIPIFKSDGTLEDSTIPVNSLASSSNSITKLDLKSSFTNLTTPIVDLDFSNGVQVKALSGVLTFTRGTLATYKNKHRMLAYAEIDEPRIGEHGLIIERTSTNKTLDSRTLGGGASSGATISESTEPFADDIDVFLLLQEDTSNGQHYTPLQGNTTIPANTWVTRSVFVKEDPTSPKRYIEVNVHGTTAAGDNYNNIVVWDLADINSVQAVYNPESNIRYGVEKFANGIMRLYVTSYYNTAYTGSTSSIIRLRDSVNNTGYVGTTGRVFVGHSQVELIDICTSYIPTTTAEVQRHYDSVTIPYTNNLPLIKGSIAAKVKISETDSATSKYVVQGNLQGNIFNMLAYYAANKKVHSNVFAAGSNSTVDAPLNSVIVRTWDTTLNQGNLYVNANEEAASGASELYAPNTTFTLTVGSADGGNALNGELSYLKIYPKVLTPTEILLLGE